MLTDDNCFCPLLILKVIDRHKIRLLALFLSQPIDPNLCPGKEMQAS